MSVPACNPDCEAPNWAEEGLKWCSFPVELPFNQWADLSHRKDESDKKTVAALTNIDLWIVEGPDDIQPAMNALYNSMRDPIIGIDTEWKYDGRGTDNDVALISLASSSCVVLVRTCNFHMIPQEVRDFCRDDEIVGVGFAWNLSDEKKMISSFGMGRRHLFKHFVDVKTLACDVLGYHDISINTLSRKVLGFELPKSQHITLSNWEDSLLNARQIRYAALDSLVAADTFRALRFYHNEKPECTNCNSCLGTWPGELDLSCGAEECKRKKRFGTISALLAHTKSTGHTSFVSKCPRCYRVTGPTVTDPEAIQRQILREPARKQVIPVPVSASEGVKSLDIQSLDEMFQETLGLENNEDSAPPATLSQIPENPSPTQKKQRQKNMPSKRRQKNQAHGMYAAYASFL